MTEKYNQLSELLSKKSVSWNEIELIVQSLGDRINDKYSDGTLLSELYLDNYFYKNGENLVKLTKLFLKHGYDVHANDDFNGAICLCDLCWASYDKYMLHIAELLLIAGANTHIGVDEDDSGISDSILWKLGYWNTDEYIAANLFEAYYQMIQAEQAGEDYRGIRDASECVGMTVTKIECAGTSHIAGGRVTFDDSLILWFGSTPLITDKKVELVVNPCRAKKQLSRVDISEELPEIIGKKLVGYDFSDANHASLDFDNGRKLVLSNNYTDSSKDFVGYIDFPLSEYDRKSLLVNMMFDRQPIEGFERLWNSNEELDWSHLLSMCCTEYSYESVGGDNGYLEDPPICYEYLEYLEKLIAFLKEKEIEK